MKGQTLVEALLALSLIGIIVSGITVVITSSLNNAQYSRNQNLATGYAQEGLEALRQIRNRNYSVFGGYDNNYCLGKGDIALGSPVINCSTPNVDNFIRAIKIEKNGCSSNISRATVTVSWNDGKCSDSGYCHQSRLISCLSTVNAVQAP